MYSFQVPGALESKLELVLSGVCNELLAGYSNDRNQFLHLSGCYNPITQHYI